MGRIEMTQEEINWADCLQYVEKNRFEINIVYPGKKRSPEESRKSMRG